MLKELASFINGKVSSAKATHNEVANGDESITVAAEALLEVCQLLKTAPQYQLNVLQVISGVDYPEEKQIHVNYMLSNFFKGHEVILKVKLDRARPVVNSVAAVWKAADWQERECYDMLGVVFENHPDPRRILCPDDWEGFPLRKDYKAAEKYRGMDVYPAAKMNFPERGFVDIQKEAEDKGKTVVRPEVAGKEDLMGL